MKIRSGRWGFNTPSSLRLGILAIAAALVGASDEAIELTTLEGEPFVACSQPAETAEVLHFWATWCPSCQEDLLALDRASRACAAGPRVLAVNVGESVEVIEEFLAGQAFEVRFLRDAKGAAWRGSGGRGLPTNLVCRGAERDLFVGPLDQESWKDRLRALGCGIERKE